eukprot:9404171-Pyramimonas_sp.AAC.3
MAGGDEFTLKGSSNMRRAAGVWSGAGGECGPWQRSGFAGVLLRSLRRMWPLHGTTILSTMSYG